MNYYFENFIGVFDSVMTKEECNILINHFDLHHAFTKNQINLVDKNKRQDDTIFVDALDYKYAPFTEMVVKKLCLCYEMYSQEYGAIIPTLADHSIDWSIRIQKTKPGGGYHVWHCEQDCIPHSQRILAWTIYLNDVEDGGETEWLYQHKRVKSKTGTICIWPASFTHTHRGNPPISNEKYISTGWISFIK
jgi:hypothetical protein